MYNKNVANFLQVKINNDDQIGHNHRIYWYNIFVYPLDCFFSLTQPPYAFSFHALHLSGSLVFSFLLSLAAFVF